MDYRLASLRFALLITAALTFSPAAAGAQSVLISGTVRDSETGALLLDADVRVLSTGARTSTDPRGRFRVAVPAGGTHEIEATRIGYLAQRLSVATGGAVTEVDFMLSASAIQIPEVAVIGRTRGQLDRIPGSAEVISSAALVNRVPGSGNEVLRSVAGIHIQEEEGLGLRANIGVRGLNPDRSRTVLVLEDGVPVALNPYGEPEMYYTPPIDRMERIEVVKGSGSILFGPQTIGGVINYVTPAPPVIPKGQVTLEGGSGESFRALASYGGTWENVGVHLGMLHRRVGDMDGLFAEVTDLTAKAGFRIGSRSSTGVKVSVYDEESNSTYVGLTEAMFLSDPYQHPAPDDRLRIRRYALSTTHDYQFSANTTLRTTAYGYTTTRDWQRQDYGYSADGNEIVFQATTGNRNRSFEVFGVEPRLQWNGALGGRQMEIDAGIRAQREYAEDAHIDGGDATARTGVVRDYEERTGNALAAFVQNRIFLSPNLQLVPGLRVEKFDYERNILRTRIRREDPTTGGVSRDPEDVDILSGDGLFEMIPGLGVNYSDGDRFTVFAGVHRGFSPPRVKDSLIFSDGTIAPGEDPGEIVSLQLDAERSVNIEFGGRTALLPGLSLEATAFYLDFSNQIIPPSLSAGSVAQGQLANQGETRHRGIETALWTDWGRIFQLPLTITTEIKHTYVDASFSADRFISRGTDTINVRGNRLPYAPENLLVLGLGVEHPIGALVRLDGIWVDEQFTDNFETVSATPNGRSGLIPSYSAWNLSGSYRLPGGVTAYGTVKNLFDSTYIASRRPQGIKPGLQRTLQLGIRTTF